MTTEIKIFLLTRYYFVFFKDATRVMESLVETLGNSPFWNLWLERYYQLEGSVETQIMLLRQAGFTYRQIQRLLEVSPSTIQRVTEQFELKYQPLAHVGVLDEAMHQLEVRARMEGVKLW